MIKSKKLHGCYNTMKQNVQMEGSRVWTVASRAMTGISAAGVARRVTVLTVARLVTRSMGPVDLDVRIGMWEPAVASFFLVRISEG